MAFGNVCEKGTQARAAHRVKHGPLRHLLLKPATVACYKAAADGFVEWMSTHRRVASRRTLDKWVSKCIYVLWRRNVGICQAINLLAGLHHFKPWSRGLFALSWCLGHCQRKQEVAAKVLPAFAVVCRAISVTVWQDGYKHGGACLVMGYDGFMRGAEMASLQKRRIKLSFNRFVIKLMKTKSLR